MKLRASARALKRATQAQSGLPAARHGRAVIEMEDSMNRLTCCPNGMPPHPAGSSGDRAMRSAPLVYELNESRGGSCSGQGERPASLRD